MDVIETFRSRLSRLKYIQKIRQFRNEGRNIIYTDMACNFTNHTKNPGQDSKRTKRVSENVDEDNRNDEGSEYMENTLFIFPSKE